MMPDSSIPWHMAGGQPLPEGTPFKRVLKYTLHDMGMAIQPLPEGSRVVSFIDQGGAIQMYAEVAIHPGPLEQRRFVVLYTGFHGVPADAEFLGTVVSEGGNIVRHIYELRAP